MTISAINCTEPPERPESGTWDWKSEYKYNTDIKYTCGPFGSFKSENGETYIEKIVSCGWNQTWVPSSLDPCVATSCQIIPFPDPSTGLLYQPEGEDAIQLQSEYTVYNPRMPFTMNFPGSDFCSGKDILLIVGKYPKVEKIVAIRIKF